MGFRQNSLRKNGLVRVTHNHKVTWIFFFFFCSILFKRNMFDIIYLIIIGIVKSKIVAFQKKITSYQ